MGNIAISVAVNSRGNILANIKVNGGDLDEVASFRYLTKDGTSTLEVKRRLGVATAAMARLATAPTTDAVKQQALAAVKARLVPGMGAENSVADYSKGAEEYDELVVKVDYTAPTKMAEAAASILKGRKSAKILDAGAGSGLGGAELCKLGYTNVDAVDASSALLEVAIKKKVYGKVMCQYLGDTPLPVEDGTYDMVTLCGAVGENHLTFEAFDDLIRVVKSGGHIVNVFREPALHVPWYGDGLQLYFEKLEKMGKWKQLDKIYFPNFLSGVEGVIFVHEIL